MESPYLLALSAWEGIPTKSLSAQLPKPGMMDPTPFVPESAKCSPCKMVTQNAAIGKESQDALRPHMISDTFAQDALLYLMEHRHVLEERKLRSVTPYDPEAWESHLMQAGLIDRYPHILKGLCQGFHLDFPVIKTTQTPPNKDSILVYTNEFNSIIKSEIEKEDTLVHVQQLKLRVSLGCFSHRSFQSSQSQGVQVNFRLSKIIPFLT
jgi:hypothetical protein